MVPTPKRRRTPLAQMSLLCTLLLGAHAQAQSTTTNRPDPLDATAQVPAVRYASTFTQFRRFDDDKTVGWREANDAVARIGGWKVYAREAQQPDAATAASPAAPAQAPAAQPVPAPTPAAAPAARPMPPGHSGHKH